MLLISSCSQIVFKSSENSGVSFDKPESLEKTNKVKFKVKKNIYFWGLLPKKQEVKIDEEFTQRGYRDLVGLEIKEAENFKQFAWFGVTLGFYYPKTYEFSAFEKI